MTILGIDPGYGIIGYGLVKYDGRQFTPVQFGAIRTEIGAPMPQRLCELYNDLNTLLETFHPEEAAVEEHFFNQKITNVIQVAQARGVILLALAQRGLRPASYTPSQVKMSVVGYGKAEKRQVMEMTRTLLGLKKVPHPDDAADALALAICHGHSLRADALR